MNKLEYWIKRMNDIDLQDILEEDELLEEILEIYQMAYDDTEEAVRAFYHKYGDEHGLSYRQATRYLKMDERAKCRDRIKRLERLKESLGDNPFNEERKRRIQREIQLLKNRGTLTREHLLFDEINEKWTKATLKVDKKLGKFLEDTAKREQKHIGKKLGIAAIALLSVREIQKAILKPTFGGNYSDRIWTHKDRVNNLIMVEIKKGIERGTNIRKTIKTVQEKFNMTKYEATRLVRTENCTIRTEAALEAYKVSEVKEVIIITAGDKKVCVDCRDHEGHVVPLNEARVGDTVPPFHAYCRCCVAPYIE